MTNTNIPATRNEGWGFWGTMGGHACIAWPLAMTAVTDATGEASTPSAPFSTAALAATSQTKSTTASLKARA